MQNKYYLIYQELANQIDKGKQKPGDLLPSEHELVDMYDTSRETIRKALNLLSEHGYIQKVQGKGSIVLDRNKFDFPISGLVSFRELAEKMGQDATTHVHQCRVTKPDSFLQKQLKLSRNEDVWEVIRAREIAGERIILDKDYFDRRYVPFLTEEICRQSIYAYLENELNLTISFARKEMVVIDASTEDQKWLDLNGYKLVVVVKNYVYLDDATLFQYTESHHRPDKFRFVDFARRNR
ncbi:trehalose operon repressor [Halalkalibacterium ligniniphilum]|uniref:trehalose operon repressor n=1 Tax=Halalkalibacterium ligniniphilum TaxID=1134413 RepID=UPI000348995E|nr:trehalose operon repressor [Halalkalibacterium ligniniphilum]